MKSINTFLCKRYEKGTVTIEDILPSALFILMIIVISIMYVNGAIIMYTDLTIINTQPVCTTLLESASIVICVFVSIFLGYVVIVLTGYALTCYISNIKIVSCKKDDSK